MSTKNGTRRTVAAVLLLGLGALVALAPAATTIHVTQPDGDRRSVDIADLDPDVSNQEYVVNGESRDVTGVSLEAVLSEAGVRPAQWGSVQIGPVFMTDDEYERFGNQTPPAFFDDQGDATFIVPDRGTNTGEIVPGAPSVRARSYSVRITPQNKEIDAGESVNFTAVVSGGGPDAEFGFRWSGSGLDPKSGPSVTYRFPDKGEKTVKVSARRGGATVAETSTTVFVDRKPDDDDGTGGSSTGSGGVGYSDSSTSSDSTGTTPSYTSPTYDSPSATPSTPSTSPEATQDESDPVPPADQAAEVAGDLLADTTPIPPAGSTGADAGLPETPEEATDDSELAISGAAVSAGVAAVLLGLGAGWEFERIRPRRWLRRPDLSRLRRLLPR